MINPSSAPTSPNAMPAGLGALTQMGPTPKGKSPSNMGQVMAMARKMSDMQLSDVLKGLSLAVPQFAAMTEAMGRKSLRNAMQGAEAQMQAKAPNLKDKLLAEESAQQMPTMPGMAPQTVMAAGGGLTSIPAPNMESMDMASGGIIAFARGGESMAGFETSEEELLADEIRRRKLVEERGGRIREDGTVENSYANLYGTKPPAAPVVPSTDAQMNADQGRSGVATPRPNVSPPGTAAPRPAGGSSPPPPAGNTVDQDIASYTKKYKNMFGQTPEFNRRANPYEGMKYEGDDPSKVREQGMGYGFMKAAQALLTHPTMSGGMGAAIGAFGDAGLLTAKEIKAAKKDERDYNFNMAKATELFEQGQEEKAIKYQTLAQDKEDKIRNLALNTVKANTDLLSANNQAKYQQGLLGIHQQQLNQQTPEIRNALFASQNPNVAPFMSSVARAQGTYSIEKAVDDFNNIKKDDPMEAKKLAGLGVKTPYDYQQYVLRKGTMGGGVGDAIQNQALAIRKERGLS